MFGIAAHRYHVTKLLLDQNLSFKLCGRLEDLFPGSSQAKLLGLDRATDAEAIDALAADEIAVCLELR